MQWAKKNCVQNISEQENPWDYDDTTTTMTMIIALDHSCNPQKSFICQVLVCLFWLVSGSLVSSDFPWSIFQCFLVRFPVCQVRNEHDVCGTGHNKNVASGKQTPPCMFLRFLFLFKTCVPPPCSDPSLFVAPLQVAWSSLLFEQGNYTRCRTKSPLQKMSNCCALFRNLSSSLWFFPGALSLWFFLAVGGERLVLR